MIIYKDQREAVDLLARTYGMNGFSEYMRERGLEHVRAAEKEILEEKKSKTSLFTIYSKILDVTLFSLDKWETNGKVKD